MTSPVISISLPPTVTATPTMPSSAPTNFSTVRRSPKPTAATSVVKSGVVDIRIAAIEAVTVNSAQPIKEKGKADPKNPKTINCRQCPRIFNACPRTRAHPIKITPVSATRTNISSNGPNGSTAIRMKIYDAPHIAPKAKSAANWMMDKSESPGSTNAAILTDEIGRRQRRLRRDPAHSDRDTLAKGLMC